MDDQPINIVTDIKNVIHKDDLDSFIILMENNPTINLFCESDKQSLDFDKIVRSIGFCKNDNSTNVVVEVHDQSIDIYDNNIATVLREEVVRNCSVKILKYLFDMGLPVDFGKNYAIRLCSTGYSAGHYIEEKPGQDTLNLLRLLIEYGVDVNAQNYLPLYSAVSDKNIDKVKLLVENGANVLRVANGNENSIYSKIDIIKYLLDNCVEIDMNLPRALFVSVQNNSVECIKFYLELGADINKISPIDIISLIKLRNTNSIRLLITNGFDFTSLNKLAGNNNVHIIDVLINEASVDITALLKILLEFW